MSKTTLKRLMFYAALASWPAVSLAQGMQSDTTSTPNSNQATKPADTQPDSMAYQKELTACDNQPAAEQATCRSKVDQKYKKSTNTPPQTSGKPTY